MYISAALSQNKKEVVVWERTKRGREEKRFPVPYYFYVRNKKGTYKDIYGNPLVRLEFDDYNSFKVAKDKYKFQGDSLYESDIRAEYKVLSEHYYGATTPKTHISLFDIEVDYDKNLGYSDVESFTAPISSIALHNYWCNETYVLAVPPPTRKDVTVEELNLQDRYPDVVIELFPNEKLLLKRFFELIEDSDILSGWNSVYFDIPYVYERTKRTLGEAKANTLSLANAPTPRYREVTDKKNRTHNVLDLFGRESIDYLEIFSKFEVVERRSYALESVSEELFPDLAKLEYEGSLYDLYRNDFEYFIRYNIRDCEILKRMEDTLGYMQLAIQFSHSSSALVRDVIGTIKVAERAIVNFCHYQLDARVPDSQYEDGGSGEKFAGALVLEPQVGMHDWVASVDVASLYPSAIRAVNISPDTIVGQFFDNHVAYDEIINETDKYLYFKYENGEMEERTAKEWKQIFIENNYSISGYGSVFTLRKNGFIPAILTDWFKQRKTYKNLASEAKDKMKSCTKGSEEYLKYKAEHDNYHRLQYIFKIRLNSLYGALGNKFFKFYDIRLAESTTRSGHQVLMHMVRTVAKHIDGQYAYPSESTIYSDTDSCYFKTHASNLEEAITIGKIIEKKVNKSFPTFTSRAFLCTGEYCDTIKAELDVIASKSIFIKKKFYVMQLDYAEGVHTDKLKLMGVQLKKTTIPKLIANKLSEFIQQLMKGREWRELGYDIVEYKDYIINDAPLDLIGLPKGINKLDEYQNQFTAGMHTKMPGHVAASVFYNMCLAKYGDTESQKIVSGMKIKVYYLNKNFGQFTSIALPTDMKTPPAWFMEHFSGIIDRPRQAKVMIDNSLQTILDAIGKRVPSPKNLMFDELVNY